MELEKYMKLEPYENLEQILIDSRYTTINHSDSDVVDNMPDRLKILGILGEDYCRSVYNVLNQIKESDIMKAKIYPSECIKVAHNFQMAIKQNHIINPDETAKIFLKTINLAIKKRAVLTDAYISKYNNNVFHITKLTSDHEKKQIAKLTTLFRACSEILYFDNHTTCGDIFTFDDVDKTIIIRNYNNLFSPYIYEDEVFPIKEIHIISVYNKLDLKFDMVGNYSSIIDINNQLCGYCIEIIDEYGNSKNLFLDAVVCIVKNLERIIKEYTQKYQSIRFEKKIELLIKCLCLVNQPLFDVSGVKFDLTKEIIKKVIKNYDSIGIYSTQDVLLQYPFEDAVEMIINPTIYL